MSLGPGAAQHNRPLSSPDFRHSPEREDAPPPREETATADDDLVGVVSVPLVADVIQPAEVRAVAREHPVASGGGKEPTEVRPCPVALFAPATLHLHGRKSRDGCGKFSFQAAARALFLARASKNRVWEGCPRSAVRKRARGNSALLQLLPRRPGRPRRGRRCAYGPSARLRVRDGRFARGASWVIRTGQPALAFVDEIELREELTMDAGVENRIVVESERASQSGRAGVIEEVLAQDPPRFRVRWDDGRMSIFAPSAGVARIERRKSARAKA